MLVSKVKHYTYVSSDWCRSIDAMKEAHAAITASNASDLASAREDNARLLQEQKTADRRAAELAW